MPLVILGLLMGAGFASAAGGGRLSSQPISYTAGSNATKLGPTVQNVFSGASYEYTGFGAAESTIDIADDGTLIFAPAFSGNKTGYAISNDNGKIWSMVTPSAKQPRPQPMFNIHDGRYFYWSSGMPGLHFSYSDDKGVTWKNSATHLQPMVQDWTKIISGKPVRSQLKNATKILYMSGPSLISVPIAPGIGPIQQAISKSLDGGITWQKTKTWPTLSAAKSGGSCAALPKTIQNEEYIIWGDGLVRNNGTIMFGLRRCRSVSVAISDDEGDTWRFSDVPGSALVSYTKGLATWVDNGNVLVAEPISQDLQNNLYAIWVDTDYSLKLSKSHDEASSWSTPLVISAPGTNDTRPMMAYHPILVHHPTTQGRAALAYYGSPDGGATWNGYVAETTNITTEFPTFTSFVANEASQPMQRNVDGKWDQGYLNPFADLIEFTGLKYHPKTDDVVAAFARKMCAKPMVDAKTFDTGSCISGWDFHKQADSTWQGYVVFGHH